MERAGTVCADGIDNDGDGATDGDDGGCIDSDRNFPSDETERILGSDPENPSSSPEDSRFYAFLFFLGFNFIDACADGTDNDGDGFTDAEDPGCSPIDADGDGFEDLVEKALGSDWADSDSKPEHLSVNPGSCSNGTDDDGDGAIDLADDGCAALPNDDLADAMAVDALPFLHTVKLIGATVEPGEPMSECSYQASDRGTVWYRFFAAENQRIVVDTSGSDFVTATSVWREGPLGPIAVNCHTSYPPFWFEDASRFSFDTLAGETYLIQVDRYAGEDIGTFPDLGRFSFRMDEGSVPLNDDFASAQQIETLPFDATVDTIAAGAEPLEPRASCLSRRRYPANSVWYRFTPSTDVHVVADSIGSVFGVTIGAYEGESLGALEQVACGRSLAFLAEAGHTYYLQAAGYQCAAPANSDSGAAGHCLDSKGGHLKLRLEAVILPSCPPSQFTLADPIGDAKPHGHDEPIDISSVSLAFSETTVCMTVGVDGALDRDRVRARVFVDSDLDRETGTPISLNDACGPQGLSTDFVAIARGAEGLLVQIVGNELGPDPERSFASYGESSFTLLLPIARIGGDRTFRLAIEILSPGYFSDCAPNGGNITCEQGVCAFAPFRNGDANCNGPTDSIDAALVLQHEAGLLANVACPDAADVDADGAIDSVDGVLILQFVAGLLERLPPL